MTPIPFSPRLSLGPDVEYAVTILGTICHVHDADPPCVLHTVADLLAWITARQPAHQTNDSA